MNSYGGSLLFAGIADKLHLSVDQLNFVFSQILGLTLATCYRTILLPPNNFETDSKSKNLNFIIYRHFFGLVFGLFIGIFCFGPQSIHLVGLPLISYFIICTQSPKYVQNLVLPVALIYLSCLHIHRQVFDYGSYGLDITGPLMVITQKVTSLAFSIHDGMGRDEKELNSNQRRLAVQNVPSLLEFFSYMLLFPSIMAGPMIFFNDYKDFIECKNIKALRTESPKRVVLKKILIATFCALTFLKLLPQFPISKVKDDHFLDSTGIVHKFWYLTVATTLVRFKYYFAWTIADAICNNAGLGYIGPNNWNGVSNVDIFKFELGKSLKESIEGWNMGTNTWLRMVVYERRKKYATELTYALSAIWHGFYPGYYLTFFSGAMFTFAARTVRKQCRHHFTKSFESKLFYDILTFVVTRLTLAYVTFPFVLLEFSGSIRLYNKLYWCLHLAAAFVLFIVPRMTANKMMSGSDAQKQYTAYAKSIKNAGYSNNMASQIQ